MLSSQSLGNYSQCPVINHSGKEYEKEYIGITEPLWCAAKINTTLYIDCTSIKYIFLEKEYIGITEPLWCAAKINTTLYIDCTSIKYIFLDP